MKGRMVLAVWGALVCVGAMSACAKTTANAAGVVISRHDKSPIEGVKVRARMKTDIQEEKQFAEFFTTTNAKGEFIIAGLPGRKYAVDVDHADYFHNQDRIELPALDQTKNFRDPFEMNKLPAYNGRVLGCVESAPLAGVQVKVIPTGTMATTDGDGKFHFDKLAEDTEAIELAFSGIAKRETLRALQGGTAPLKGDFYLCVNDSGADEIRQLAPPFTLKALGSASDLGEPRTSGHSVTRDGGVRKLSGGRTVELELEGQNKDPKFNRAHVFATDVVEKNLFAVRNGATILLPNNENGFEQYPLFKHKACMYRVGENGIVALPAGYYLGVQTFKIESKTEEYLYEMRTMWTTSTQFVSGDAVQVGEPAVGAPRFLTSKVVGDVGQVYMIAPLLRWHDSMYNSTGVNWDAKVYFVQVTGDGIRAPVADQEAACRSPSGR